jgi:hypothetical protein
MTHSLRQAKSPAKPPARKKASVADDGNDAEPQVWRPYCVMCDRRACDYRLTDRGRKAQCSCELWGVSYPTSYPLPQHADESQVCGSDSMLCGPQPDADDAKPKTGGRKGYWAMQNREAPKALGMWILPTNPMGTNL